MPPTNDARIVSNDLVSKLKGARTVKKRTEPLWKGPCNTGEMGGITFSMLSRFLVCRERFRIAYVEGIKPAPRFNHRIEYGHMWHLCEETYLSEQHSELWSEVLADYCKGLCEKYRTDQEQIKHWYQVCRTQFPLYLKYWAKHPDMVKSENLLREKTFSVSYTLPSGRVVILRGKLDSVDRVTGKGSNTGIWLFEHKTKGDINADLVQRQLTFDLQTMLYMVALNQHCESDDCTFATDNACSLIRGVRYNVVRRPLSGGKGTIVRHKPTGKNPRGESPEEFYARLGTIIKEDAPNFFMRWNVVIAPGDVKRFRERCLDPILEQLCHWWDVQTTGISPHLPHWAANWQHPFGCYNILDEGGASDLDSYIASGDMIGLQRVENLFEELQ